jgi:ubiquinone/menaquinone biosynthesis C-methylase UbiE
MTEAAQLYDASVPDWPGELAFYHELAREVIAQQGALLEVACGTGRVAVRLAHTGVRIVGLDQSAELLAGAKAKSSALANVRWVEGDMRSFALGERFALVIIPGHSFQFMLTPADQLTCLAAIQRHLEPGGRLVVHLDQQSLEWLGALRGPQGGQFMLTQELTHPQNGRRLQIWQAWSYNPATQTATARTRNDTLDDDGQVRERVEHGPTKLHCVFPFEMEHLLARVGFQLEAVYGDFFRGPLSDTSTEMIWVARRLQADVHQPA